MARRKKHEEHENHERWLVSYADFITLLFAFFVVMYSISSVNEGKYRVLSESLVAAFRSSTRSMQPVQVGDLARSPKTQEHAIIELPKPMEFAPVVIDPEGLFMERPELSVNENEWALDQASEQVEDIAKKVEETMTDLMQEDLVTVTQERLWLEVEINTSLLFASGSADPSLDAEVILKRLAGILRDFPNQVHVEGFTDNEPIGNSIYPSNWELSSARAAAVVRLFDRFGIQPRRMASVGYGEYRPIASNENAVGRAQNRRVVIVVVANLQDDVDQANYGNLEVIRQRMVQPAPTSSGSL